MASNYSRNLEGFFICLWVLDGQGPDVEVVGDVINDFVDKHTVDGHTCAEAAVDNHGQGLLIVSAENGDHQLHQDCLDNWRIHWKVRVGELLLC